MEEKESLLNFPGPQFPYLYSGAPCTEGFCIKGSLPLFHQDPASSPLWQQGTVPDIHISQNRNNSDHDLLPNRRRKKIMVVSLRQWVISPRSAPTPINIPPHHTQNKWGRHIFQALPDTSNRYQMGPSAKQIGI